MKKYVAPEMEITELETKDIITISNTTSSSIDITSSVVSDVTSAWDPDGGFGWEEEEEEPW